MYHVMLEKKNRYGSRIIRTIQADSVNLNEDDVFEFRRSTGGTEARGVHHIVERIPRERVLFIETETGNDEE